MRQSGSAFVLDGGFDVIYSALAHLHKEIGAECKGAAFSVLQRGLNSLEKELDRVLQGEVHGMGAADKESWLNKTKMLVYLMCQMMELLEAQDTSGLANLPPAGGAERRQRH